jgi:hypothetical protein
MKANMLYCPKDVRFEERPAPVILQPTPYPRAKPG